ncbi:Protein Y53G8AR.7 a [Aphelenchoides avenae]|nr:Protein Y53G8AR.7 a [Aphelenchus avenae]
MHILAPTASNEDKRTKDDAAPKPDPDGFETNWRSIYIVTLVAFIGAVHQNCIAPSVYPYLQKMDSSATEMFYGYLRSASAVGSVSSAVAAGYISNRLRDTKWPMVFAKAVAIVSCLIYMRIETWHGGRKAMFMIFELFLGISVGAAGIYRCHVAMASTERDRPKAVAICSLAPAIGLLVGPASQLGFTYLGYPGVNFLFGTHINLYTAPILFTIIISVVGIVLLLFWFDGRMRMTCDEREMAAQACEMDSKCVAIDGTSQTVLTDQCPIIAFDRVAVFVCMFTKMVMGVTILNFMTIGSPYAMTVFQWRSDEAVKAMSIILGLIGLHIILWNMLYVFFDLRKRLSERRAMLIGTSVLLFAYLITYPWPFLSKTIAYQKLPPGINSTASMIGVDGIPQVEEEIVGCRLEYEWCGTTPAVDMVVFLGSLIISMGIAIPICQINLDILYSKVLGPIRQGAMQGWFIVCGDGISIIGPMVLSKVYTVSGPTYIWQFEIALILSCIALWILFYKRMISHTQRCTQAGV